MSEQEPVLDLLAAEHDESTEGVVVLALAIRKGPYCAVRHYLWQ